MWNFLSIKTEIVFSSNPIIFKKSFLQCRLLKIQSFIQLLYCNECYNVVKCYISNICNSFITCDKDLPWFPHFLSFSFIQKTQSDLLNVNTHKHFKGGMIVRTKITLKLLSLKNSKMKARD